MKVIKYVGVYSGAEGASLKFYKNVPTIVERDSVANSLLAQPDFVLSSIEELQSYKPAPAESEAPAPVPAPVKETK
ncbi:hypothetical protein Dxin01_00181 [Deinococcus xinjiangensis]|uniref:Uncharacterized protein n=1 Tax=Deinococcus xinjiangensis TaxID=457454 RepID=A0ABP9V593_9DEIO